ncbi:hypothetical protein C0Z22_00455 [Halobacteriovorax sp. DA5]|nr:hypothetical protein C0Z22_00455 [Halobacteriovorax sp. DA5]
MRSEGYMKGFSIKTIAIITLVIQSSIVFAEKYETPAFYQEAQKPISFKKKVVHHKSQESWEDSYQVEDDSKSEKSKRLPSSKNTKVKYWDYENKK